MTENAIMMRRAAALELVQAELRRQEALARRRGTGPVPGAEILGVNRGVPDIPAGAVVEAIGLAVGPDVTVTVVK